MAAKEPVPARSSASRTRPPLPPLRAASLGATPSLRASRVPAAAATPRPRPGPAPGRGPAPPRLRPVCGAAAAARTCRVRYWLRAAAGGSCGGCGGRGAAGGGRPLCSAGASQGRDSGTLWRSLRVFFPRCFPGLLRCVISQASLPLLPPPSPPVKASHPPDDFLEGETKGRNRPPGRHSSSRVDLNDGSLLECLQHLVFSLCACKRCQTHNGSLSVTELGCSLFRFHLKIQPSPSGLTARHPRWLFLTAVWVSLPRAATITDGL
ncbi:forkhead box protein D2-like [Lutra lutra]|uniref:forkhead box protein D2-like n=1 Tax=Lutra lutra TaxID=9657 RepID=UPI001FD526F4|nr:forkhead box protein D2-like [Lutra lutra]